MDVPKRFGMVASPVVKRVHGGTELQHGAALHKLPAIRPIAAA
ncbi:hypothetical protein [Bradyrhizobium sp. CCBAU 53338]|nr:hypothetical protein [Bradyrhizobium sp. CCBAU 53338]